MKCRAGDLAVVVRSRDPLNLGRVVRVSWADAGDSGYTFPWEGPTWWIEASEPMIWLIGGRPHAMYCGPVPDHCLQPIRGTDRQSDIVF